MQYLRTLELTGLYGLEVKWGHMSKSIRVSLLLTELDEYKFNKIKQKYKYKDYQDLLLKTIEQMYSKL